MNDQAHLTHGSDSKQVEHGNSPPPSYPGPPTYVPNASTPYKPTTGPIQGYGLQPGQPVLPAYPPSSGNPQKGLYPPDQQNTVVALPGSFPSTPEYRLLYNLGSGDPIQDPEAVKGFDFSNESIRKGFIRKVYSILLMQLIITLGYIFLFVYHEPSRRWVATQGWPLLVGAIVVVFASLICLICCGDLRRRAPMNLILLSIFTLAEGFCVGVTASTYEPEAVLMAVSITAIVTLGLTLFAFQTKWDFTICNGILFVFLLILIIFGFAAIFIQNMIFKLLIASAGALIFSVFIIVDTQMMMSGEHKYTLSPEEYIYAALNLYLDILNLFLYILRIVSIATGKN